LLKGAAMDARTSEETRNEQVIRTLYSLAEAKSKDTPKFVSLFANDGYFYDVAVGKNTTAVINAQTLPKVQMPNRDSFITRFPERTAPQ